MTVFKKYNTGIDEWEAIAVGKQGEKGEGVPEGGTQDQVLAKVSATDYDTAWVALSFVDAAGAVSAIKADADWNAADWDTAFAKAHDQNTDTALDQGGANEVTAADARAHIDATNNPHGVTKADVGLSNVDNVSAADLRDRSTHTGTQAATTVTYDNTASGLVATDVKGAVDELQGAKVAQTDTAGSAEIPSGTQAQRDATPSAGFFRFNTDTSQFEGYNGAEWGEIGGGGGATGGGDDEVFIENDQIVTTNYTIPVGKNALTTGPVEIDPSATVTISSGSRWVVI